MPSNLHTGLTTFQRKDAQKHLKYYQFYSGAIGNLLGSSLLTLVVLSFNCNSYAAGFIVSCMQFTTFFGILVPAFFYGRDYVKHKVQFWRIRGYICILYFILLITNQFFLKEKPYGDSLTILLICLTYGLFCLFRSLGMISLFPVFNATAVSQERGKILSSYTHFGNLGSIASFLLSYVILYLLSFENTNYSFMFLIFIGLLCNFGSSYEFNKVSSIGLIPKMDLYEVVRRIKSFIFDRKLIVIWIAKFFADSMIITFGFVAVYLKKCQGLNDSNVIMYAFVMLIGRIVASLLSGKISDILGQRPLLFYIHILIAIFGFLLIYYPTNSPNMILLMMLVFISFLFCFSDILIGQLVYAYAPKQDVISYGAANTLIAASAALANGFLIGALLDQKPVELISFTPVWLLVIFYSISILLLLFFLTQKEDVSITTVASSFISFRNLRGVFAISALNEEVDQDKKAMYLNHIAVINQPYAQKEIIRYLKSSNMITRRSAYQALRLNPIPAAYEVVFLEAKREDGYIRDDAVYNLRYYPTEEVISFLRKLSLEKNFYGIQAVLSLSYILNKEDEDLKSYITNSLLTEKIPQYRSRMIYSLTKVADVSFSLQIILNEAKRQTSKEFIRFLYISLASKFQWGDNLELAFSMEDEEKKSGLYEIVAIVEHLPFFKEHVDRLLKDDTNENNKWLLEQLKIRKIIDTNFSLEGVVYVDACMFALISVLSASESGYINPKN